MKTYKPNGYIGMGQLVHGSDNGENVWIYTTYANLSEVSNWVQKTAMKKRLFLHFIKKYQMKFFPLLIQEN
jgi:hypothetical protein